MKLIIFEGCDRTGKDTLINELVKNMPNVIKRHWTSPKGNTNEERIDYQKKSFNEEFKLYNDLKLLIPDTNMIWNRGHLGELVYGTLYRQYDPDNWINNLELKYSFNDCKDIYLVYLYGDVDFLVNNDDGESFSNDIKMKEKELDLFFHAFYKTTIKNKIKIKINKKDKYTPLEESLERINKFIYESN